MKTGKSKQTSEVKLIELQPEQPAKHYRYYGFCYRIGGLWSVDCTLYKTLIDAQECAASYSAYETKFFSIILPIEREQKACEE